MKSGVLVVFAKAPEPGRVKTRLAPPLTPEAAALFYEASLRDTLDKARASVADVRIAYDDRPGARSYFRREFPDLAVLPQPKGDLGVRMSAVFHELFGSGAARVAILGADSPTLPPERLERSLRLLDTSAVVLGPCEDGGYYLVAVRSSAWPRAAALFDDVPWSTDQVLTTTLRRAADARLAPTLLEPWYDVDTWAEVQRAGRDAAPGTHLGRLLADSRWRNDP